VVVLGNGDRWMVEVEKQLKTAIAMVKTGALRLVALDSVVGSARGAQGLKTQDAGRGTRDAGLRMQGTRHRAQTQ
jgi:hypothetical protein